MNALGAQWYGGIFILQFISLKMAVLLHKTALVNFPMASSVTIFVLLQVPPVTIQIKIHTSKQKMGGPTQKKSLIQSKKQ